MDYRGKTTHQMAAELLALPDVPLEIEMWCRMDGYEQVAKMTEYDPDGTAIICMERFTPDDLDFHFAVKK